MLVFAAKEKEEHEFPQDENGKAKPLSKNKKFSSSKILSTYLKQFRNEYPWGSNLFLAKTMDRGQ